MAGRPVGKARKQSGNDPKAVADAKLEQELKKANARIKLQAEEIQALKAELARINPDAITINMEEASYPPTEEHCKRALALGEIGLTPKQIQAELMWSDEQWNEALSRYPQFSSAVSRSCARARGMWTQKIHDSLVAQDWKFPYDKAMNFVETQFDTGAAVDGNAVDVVHVAIGREARAMFSREVEAQ